MRNGKGGGSLDKTFPIQISSSSIKKPLLKQTPHSSPEEAKEEEEEGEEEGKVDERARVGMETEDWDLSAEELDSLERDAFRQIALRNSSSSTASVSNNSIHSSNPNPNPIIPSLPRKVSLFPSLSFFVKKKSHFLGFSQIFLYLFSKGVFGF